MIKAAKGFKYEARAPQEASFVAQKWGLSAEKPGANATLEVDSELGGLSGQLQTVQVGEAKADTAARWARTGALASLSREAA